jgi:hypothetical protein
VLRDNPVSFFLLDEVKSGDINSYTALSNQYATYQDLKDNGISYAAISGLPIIDYTGNGMEGYSVSSSDIEVLPIIGGGVRGTEINDITQIQLKATSVATNKKPDSDFAFEIWFKPSRYDLEEYPVIADQENSIGIFYSNENVIFKINSNDMLQAKVSKTEAHHIVSIFSKYTAFIYVDGELVAEKSFLNKPKFLNESLAINLGPANPGNSFILDSAAIYDYRLSDEQIKNHYSVGYRQTNISQIVYSNLGTLFSFNSITTQPSLSYKFPGTKSLEEIVVEDAFYDTINSRISFEKTDEPESKTFSFTERLYVPNADEIVSSRIIYGQDVNNILVEISIPGEEWRVCKNNFPLPYYNKNENSFSEVFDVRVTMETLDSSSDIPYLDKLEIDMYLNKDFYSDNTSDRAYSDYDYSLGRYNYPPRIQNIYDGITMLDGHGFSIDLSIEPSTIELFFSPEGSSNTLFSSEDSYFSWNSQGVISKEGIDLIYVNGIDRTSEENLFDFMLSGVSHHVIFKLSSPASNIKFNQNQSGDSYGLSNTYSNIAFYEEGFSSNKMLINYRLYCSDNTVSVEDSSISIIEDDNGMDGSAFYSRNFDDVLTIY